MCGRLRGIQTGRPRVVHNAQAKISRRLRGPSFIQQQVTRCRQEQWPFGVVISLDKTVGEFPIFRRERDRILDLELEGKAHLSGFNQ